MNCCLKFLYKVSTEKKLFNNKFVINLTNLQYLKKIKNLDLQEFDSNTYLQ